MNEKRKQHLDFIHNTINRFSAVSIQLKAITVTLTAGLLAVYASNAKILLLILSTVQVLFFWFLDSYYLQQERKFRGIYNDVSGVTSNHIIRHYEMPINKYVGGKFSWLSCLTSISKLLFFGSMFFIQVIFLGFVLCNGSKSANSTQTQPSEKVASSDSTLRR